jgi:hypothetical protein
MYCPEAKGANGVLSLPNCPSNNAIPHQIPVSTILGLCWKMASAIFKSDFKQILIINIRSDWLSNIIALRLERQQFFRIT